MSFKPPIQNRRGFLSALAKGIGVLASPDAVTNVARAAGRPNQPLKAGLGHVYRTLFKTTGEFHEYSPYFTSEQREHITQIAMAALHKTDKEKLKDLVVSSNTILMKVNRLKLRIPRSTMTICMTYMILYKNTHMI